MSRKFVFRLVMRIRTISARFLRKLLVLRPQNTKTAYSSSTKRIIPFILCIIIPSVLLISCTGITKNNHSDTSEREVKKIKIGFSMGTLNEERWLRDRDIFVAKANELGAEVIIQNANNSTEEQFNQVRYLLDQDIDVLAIVPHDAEKASKIVQLAKKEGVKVISYDRLVKNADADVYISFDNVRVGELMAERLVKRVPRGDYVIINGAKTDNNTSMYNQGYKNVLNPLIEKGDIKIVAEIWAEDWSPEEAYKYMEKVLRKGITIDAVIAANDSLAASAIQALAVRRLAGKVPVVGHDADLSGCQRVVERTQLMTIYKPIDKIAQAAAEIAITLAKDEKVNSNTIINDGEYDIPYYKIKPIAITKENMVQTIIQDGFHKLEDVFRNVPKSEWPKEQ